MVRILIADDHPIMRKGIRQILADLPGETNIEEAGGANELFQKIDNTVFDIVISEFIVFGKFFSFIAKFLTR